MSKDRRRELAPQQAPGGSNRRTDDRDAGEGDARLHDGVGSAEARLGSSFQRLRLDGDRAIASFLRDELPAWQRMQARVVLSRIVGTADADAHFARAFGDEPRSGSLGQRLLAAVRNGHGVGEALATAEPAQARATLRGLRDANVEGRPERALQLVARASEGAAARVLADGSAGAPLARDDAARLGPHVGADAVAAARVHTDDDADAVAAAHRARAVTVGRDIYFAHGEYQPGSARGDELLAHELAHVDQALRGELYRAAAKGIESGGVLDASEAEADLRAKVAVVQLHYPDAGAPPLAAPSGQPTSDGERAAKIAAQQARINAAQAASPGEAGGDAMPPTSKAQAPDPHAPPPMAAAPGQVSTGNAYVDTFQAPPSKQALELWAGASGKATTEAAADQAKFEGQLPPLPVNLDGAGGGAAGGKGGAKSHSPKQAPHAGSPPPAATAKPTPAARPVTAGAAATQSLATPPADKAQLKADGSKAIDALPTSADNVNTDPGPAPVTDLAGQADPVRAQGDHAHAMSEGAKALETEKQKIVSGPGAALVQPLKVDEKLKVPKENAAGGMPQLPSVEGMAKMKKWNLPTQVQGSFDELAKPKMEASLATAKGKMQEASHQRDADRTKAVSDAQTKVKQAHADADKQQQSKVAETRTQIANHQADALVQQEDAVKKLDKESGEKKKGTVGKIQQRIQSDQEKVDGDYQGAEQKAKDEQKKGEEEAKKKKEEAEKKKDDDSWWDKAADAVCDAIEEVADAIDHVLSAIAEAVGKILDAVKDAACKLIDAARDFVCQALSELGDWLKSAVTALLGSVFPELAAALNRLIDAAVDLAKKAVNAIADGLKKAVTALCDGLKGFIDGIIAAFKAAVQAAATLAKALVTGDWALVGKMILEGILKLLGIDPAAFYALIGKAADSIDKIIENPGAFVGHLIDAVKLGFKQFGANFWAHLKDGLVQWLFGTFASAGIQMPARFDVAGIFDLVCQVLGLTWPRLRGKVVKVIGEKNTARLEFVAKYIEALVTGGFAGLWEKVQQDMSNLWDMVINGVKDWIIEKVVQQAIIKIATMWNPAGAIIQLIQTAWNVYCWVKENAQRIFGLIQAVVDSISNIVAGNISGAANFIEASLAKLVPIAISLFANLLGLGGIADKIKGIIEKVQTKVDTAIDKLIERVLAMFKGKDGKGKDDGKSDGHDDKKKVGETIPFQAAKEAHKLWIVVQSGTPTVMVASTPMTVEQRLAKMAAAVDGLPDEKKAEARSLLGRAHAKLDTTNREAHQAVTSEASGDDQQVVSDEQSLADIMKLLFEIFGEEGVEEIKAELAKLLHPQAMLPIEGLSEGDLKKVLTLAHERKSDVSDLLRVFQIKKEKGKPVPEGEVMTFLVNRLNGVDITSDRGYPFGFDEEAHYRLFCERVRAAVAHWGLPTQDIRVQGSSVNKPEPKDIDVAVMVGAEMFDDILERAAQDSTKSRLLDKLRRDANEKGIITSFNLWRIEVPADTGLGQPREGARSPKLQLVHAIEGDKSEKGTSAQVQISVVKSGGSFDLGPYIPV